MFQTQTVCKIKSEMKQQLNIDIVQVWIIKVIIKCWLYLFKVSVDGVDDEGSPVSRSEFGFESDSNTEFNPFSSSSPAGKVVTAPTSLNIFQQPNSQIKVC